MKTLVFIVLCLVWGSTWTAIKLGLQDAPPVWSSGLRITLAGLILLIYNKLAGNIYPAGWHRRWQVAWPGILMYGASYALVYFGMQHISSALGSILFAVFPFFIILLVPFLIKSEKITVKSVIGVMIGFSGIVVIFAGPINLNTAAFMGAALVVIATSASAYSTVHIKAFLHDEPIPTMMAMQMILGGTLTLILALVIEDFSQLKFTSVTIGSILYLATFGSILTFAGYYWLLTRIDTVKLSLVAFLTPIVSILLGYLVLSESLTTQDFIGSALVLAGVIVVAFRD